MNTFQDLEEVLNTGSEEKIKGFIYSSIDSYKSSDMYKQAKLGHSYFIKQNETILNFIKYLYTMSGEAVPDNFSANYKIINGFFRIFVKQEVSYLLGKGIQFEDSKTKERFGKSFDKVVKKVAKSALWGGVGYGYYNFDKIQAFNALEFVPFFDEETSALKAGVRFWQLDNTKPLRATLYELDGLTEYIWKEGKGEVLKPKQTYRQITIHTVVDGTEILNGGNYPNFPIVPLWGNEEHTTELLGLREGIDCYDLIKSGFANDLDSASELFWLIKNAGGMDEVDYVKFLERLKTTRVAAVDEDGATAEPHTIDVPYSARSTALSILKDDLYRDAMALDVDKISAGNTTATEIEASYENLDMKCDDFEDMVSEFVYKLLELVGVEDNPTYERSRIINKAEMTQVVLSAAQFLPTEILIKKLPIINPSEVDDILDKIEQEQSERYANDENTQENPEENPEENTNESGVVNG